MIRKLLILGALALGLAHAQTGVKLQDSNANDLVCNKQATFNISASGDTQIIAAPADASSIIRVCHLSFSTTAAEDIKVDQGTGTNCATNTVSITGLYKSVQSAVFQYSSQSPLRTTVGGSAVCLNTSTTTALGGVVIYAITSN